MIEFIIKSTLSLFFIYTLYVLFLTKEKLPVFKRFYLLAGISFSIVVSLITIRVNIPITNVVESKITSNYFSFHWILYAVYAVVSVVLVIRFVRNILRLVKLQQRHRTIQLDGCNLVLVNQNSLPFSFINYVFVDEQAYIKGAFTKEILLHELAHVKQKHSLDIIFIELLQILLWFNPVIWLYKREMQLNHEYLADNNVLNSGVEKNAFLHFLINIVSENNTTSLASSFSYASTKKRLTMLTLGESPIRRLIKVAILIPVIVFMGIMFAFSQSSISDNAINALQGDNKIVGNSDSYKPQFEISAFYNTQYYKESSGNNCIDECSDTRSK